MSRPVLWTQLSGGRTVLAKLYKGRPAAVTYANLTQAQTRAAQLRREGYSVSLTVSHPVYIQRHELDAMTQEKP